MKTKDLIQYHWAAMEAFYQFLKDSDLTELLSKLKRIEKHYRRLNELPNDERGLWFRLFDGDTTATSIADIERVFTNDTRANQQYMRDLLFLCCDEAQIQIYYS